MAAKRFLRNVVGRITEVLGIVVSAGAANDGDIPALDATGRLDASMMPVGIVADSMVMATTENLAAGDMVNVFLSAGVIKARRADATVAGKEANGFVLAATVSPANATVIFEGRNTALAGKTIGAKYYLSAAAPGGIVEAGALPNAAGNVIQYVGTALSATELTFEPDTGIVLA